MFGIKIAIFAPKRQQFLISAANSDAKVAPLVSFSALTPCTGVGDFFCKKCPALLRGDINNLIIACTFLHFPFFKKPPAALLFSVLTVWAGGVIVFSTHSIYLS